MKVGNESEREREPSDIPAHASCARWPYDFLFVHITTI